MMEGGQGWEQLPTRRPKCTVPIGDILLIGEQLRILMHTDNPHLIKDRRQRLWSYSCSFVGREAVEWIVKSQQAPDKDTAIYLMNLLLENNVFHHVSDDVSFKDDNQLYRFRKDDGTFPWHEDVAIFLRGQRLHHRLCSDRRTVMGEKDEDGTKYLESFYGNELVDWILKNKDAINRDDAVKLGRRLLENDVIRHVTDSHHFKDEHILYQFKTDFNRKFDLMDLIRSPEDCGKNEIMPGSAKDGLKIPQEKRAERAESGYHSLQGEGSTGSLSNHGSPLLFGSVDSVEDAQQRLNILQISPNAALLRTATASELEDPNLYQKRNIRIASDPVGFGFVIRGEGPVFVKTVDPMGPAYESGLRVGHYIYKINDKIVLHMNHREMANAVLACMGYMRLVIFEYIGPKLPYHS